MEGWDRGTVQSMELHDMGKGVLHLVSVGMHWR
jgi:hypothetical protein